MTFQVRPPVQNLGQADAGPFHVQFLLTGAAGSLDHAIFLGDATVPGLTAGVRRRWSARPSTSPAGSPTA